MRKTLAAVLAALVWTIGAMTVAAQSEDDKRILDHRLTLDLVQRTVAVDRDLVAAIKKDPTLLKQAPRRSPGLDASAEEMEKIPELARILKANGMSGRDYLLSMMAMFSTTITHEFMASGKMPGLPAGMPTHNLDFWKANAEALKPLEAEWKKLRGEIMAMTK